MGLFNRKVSEEHDIFNLGKIHLHGLLIELLPKCPSEVKL